METGTPEGLGRGGEVPVPAEGAPLASSPGHDTPLARKTPTLSDLAPLLDMTTDGLYITDTTGRLLGANARFARMIGVDPDDLATLASPDPLRKPPLSVFTWNGQWSPEEIETELAKNLSLAPEEVRVFETRHRRRDGSLFPVEVVVRRIGAPEDPLLLHFVRDISRRQAALDTLDRMSRYEALRRAATALAFSATRTAAFMEEICRVCTREEKEILLAFIARPDASGRFEFLASAGRTGFLEGSRIVLDPSLPQGQGPTATCYREGRPIFNAPLADAPGDPPWKERARRFGLRSLSVLPIVVNGRIFAVLALGHGDPRPVDPPLADLISELALSVSRGIERLEVLHRESEHASLVALLIDNADSGILLLEGERIREANGTLGQMLGYDPEELRDLSAAEIFGEGLPAAPPGEEGPLPPLGDVPVRKKDGEILLCDLTRKILPRQSLPPPPSGGDPPLLTVVSLRESRLRHQSLRHIERVSHFRTLLAEAAETMAEASDEEDLFEKICRLAVDHAGLPLVWIGRPGPDGIFRFLAKWGHTGYLEGLTLSLDPRAPTGMASAALTFREGRTVVSPSFVGPLAPWRDHAARFGLAASVTLPIRRGGRVDAVLTAYHAEENAFDAELSEILEELAKNISRGIDRLEVARDRQRISDQNEAILSSPAIGILLTVSGRIRQINPKMRELLGHPSPADIEKGSLPGFFDPEEGARIVEAGRQILDGKDPGTLEIRTPARVGFRWLGLSGVPFPGEEGGILWTASDITSQRQAQENQRLFANALLSLDEGVAISDPRGTVLYVNAAFERLTGYSARSMVGQNCRLLQGPETDPETVREIRQALARGQSFRKALRNYRKDGTPFWNLLSLVPLKNSAGVITHYVGVQNDITDIRELEEQNERLAFLSRHDPLTGLTNRTALEEHLERTLSREMRNGTPFAVGMIDLDDFKPVNDTWGHQTGDQLLREIARRLAGALRHHDLAVRLGGDEFVVVVENLEGGERSPAFPALLDRIHKSLTAPFVLGEGISTRVGLSMGIAFFPEDGTTPESLLKTADTVLGQLKEKKNERGRWWGTAREGVPEEGGVNEEELPFGGEVRKLLSKHAPLIEESIRDFVRDFYKTLPRNAEAARVLSRLSPREREHLARGQESYLREILSPDCGRESVVVSSRRIGEIHFLTGVSSGLLIEATSVYRRLLSSHLRRALLYDRERRVLLEAADRRIEIHIATEIQTQAGLQAATIDAALAWGSPSLSMEEAVRRILDLPGMVGLCLMARNAGEGRVAMKTWGECPGGIEELGARPLPPSPIESFASLSDLLPEETGDRDNPSIRSALRLSDDQKERSLRLLIFGGYPNQFASEALGSFSQVLRSRLFLTPPLP